MLWAVELVPEADEPADELDAEVDDPLEADDPESLGPESLDPEEPDPEEPPELPAGTEALLAPARESVR